MSWFGLRDALKRRLWGIPVAPPSAPPRSPSSSDPTVPLHETRESQPPLREPPPLPDLLTPRRRRRIVAPPPSTPLPSGVRFRVLVLDPPWRYGDRLTMSDVKRGADANYQGTMSFAQIQALPCRSLADDDAILCLWVGNPILHWGFELLAGWGFEYKQPWHWVKTTKGFPEKGKLEDLNENALAFGMGRLSRTCSETMLVGTRGRIYDHLQSRRERNVIPHRALPHSRKPEVFQDRLDRMFPEGERLELFARRKRDPWVCVGNEAPDTLGEDVFVSCNRLLGVPFGTQESLFPSSEVSP